jgi:hypothetical protein
MALDMFPVPMMLILLTMRSFLRSARVVVHTPRPQCTPSGVLNRRGDHGYIKAWPLVTHDASSPTYRRLKRPVDVADRALVGSFRLTPPVVRAWERTLECARLLRDGS